MARKDIKSRTLLNIQSAKAAATSTVTGTGVEVADYDGALAVIDAGTWTDGTHTISVQESDDNSAWSAVADADLDGSEPVIDGAADDDQQYYIGYHGNKRYLRLVNTVGSATTGAVIGMYIILGEKKAFS